jgi:uroporphyrinogen decarboxylase
MNGKERVYNTIAHKRSDRTACSYEATYEVSEKLIRQLGIDKGLKYCHHSCGGIRPIIPDMIEIGFDIINPLQPLARGMEPGELSEEFGKDIAFYGGIDEQKTLPFGTVEDVKAEVKQRIGTFGKYNGYIAAPSHAFQPDTPIENILAVYEVITGQNFS